MIVHYLTSNPFTVVFFLCKNIPNLFYRREQACLFLKFCVQEDEHEREVAGVGYVAKIDSFRDGRGILCKLKRFEEWEGVDLVCGKLARHLVFSARWDLAESVKVKSPFAASTR